MSKYIYYDKNIEPEGVYMTPSIYYEEIKGPPIYVSCPEKASFQFIEMYKYEKARLNTDRELLWMIGTSIKHRVLFKFLLFQGSHASVEVDLEMILRYAILYKAKGIMLAHNHPSGQGRFSAADKDILKQIQNGVKPLKKNILDFFVIYEDYDDNKQIKYLSAANENFIL